MSIFRLTGQAGAVRERSGESNGQAWKMRSQSVQVNEFVVTDVGLRDEDAPMRVGEHVDLIVEVSAKGGYLRTELRGDWPKTGIHSAAKVA